MPFVDAPLDVRKVGDKAWKLLAPVTYRGDYGRYTVPAGYVTDFASVPRLLWTLFPQSGRWDTAAVVHDWLISDVLELGSFTPFNVFVTSAQVDAEFRGALKAVNVGFIRRWLMWSGVRWAAVANHVRRPGWWKTLPQLLGVTALSLAPVAGVVSALVAWL